MELLGLFGNNLLPVFLAAGAGYLLAATTKLDVRPVSHVAFFVFAPCLVFHVIVKSEAPGEAMVDAGVNASAAARTDLRKSVMRIPRVAQTTEDGAIDHPRHRVRSGRWSTVRGIARTSRQAVVRTWRCSTRAVR